MIFENFAVSVSENPYSYYHLNETNSTTQQLRCYQRIKDGLDLFPRVTPLFFCSLGGPIIHNLNVLWSSHSS